MIVRLHRFAVFAIVLACSVVPSTTRAAQARSLTTREYEVKAVFLFNFARFVEWPAENDAECFVICVLGADPFGEVLDEAVRGERVGTRRLEVKRISSIEEAARCDQVFIARSEQHRLAEILEYLGTRPILTVSDIPHFAERGGMVGLVSSGGRTKLRINLEVAKAAALSISSKLLRPAEIVTTRKTTRLKKLRAPGRLAESNTGAGAERSLCSEPKTAHSGNQPSRAAAGEKKGDGQALFRWSWGLQTRQERSQPFTDGDQ